MQTLTYRIYDSARPEDFARVEAAINEHPFAPNGRLEIDGNDVIFTIESDATFTFDRLKRIIEGRIFRDIGVDASGKPIPKEPVQLQRNPAPGPPDKAASALASA